MAIALQFAGSLIAILALAWLARRMGLGGDIRIRDEAHARELADDAICGFEPAEIAIDRAGQGALLRDTGGRILILRRHGSHFAARLLSSASEARLDRNLLTISPAEASFGSFTLDLGQQAQHWAARFRSLGGTSHA